MKNKFEVNESDYTKIYIYKMLEHVHNPAILHKIHNFIQAWIEVQEKDGGLI